MGAPCEATAPIFATAGLCGGATATAMLAAAANPADTVAVPVHTACVAAAAQGQVLGVHSWPSKEPLATDACPHSTTGDTCASRIPVIRNQSMADCPGCGRAMPIENSCSFQCLCMDCLHVLRPVGPFSEPPQPDDSTAWLVNAAPSLPKQCEYEGCTKAAAPGGLPFCVAHGGGRKCEHEGCNKVARAGGPPLCKAHGGGRRCQFVGCQKSAASGGSPFCAAHGGGRRCEHAGCQRSARAGGPSFCAAHGGGKRCEHDDLPSPVHL